MIENKTGEVKAMVGGNDFQHRPFNLATNGHRQPGSAIKPFILASALTHGISPSSVWTSAPRVFRFRRRDGKVDYFGGTQLPEHIRRVEDPCQRDRLVGQLGLRG